MKPCISMEHADLEFHTVLEATEWLERNDWHQIGAAEPESNGWLATYERSNDDNAFGVEDTCSFWFPRTPGRVDSIRPRPPHAFPKKRMTADEPTPDPTTPHNIADDFAELSDHEAHDRAMSQLEWDGDTPEQMEMIF